MKATRQNRLKVLKAPIQSERKDVAMRTQQNAVGNQQLLGVEHVIEAKSTLARNLYSEVSWHDPLPDLCWRPYKVPHEFYRNTPRQLTD